MTIGIVYLEKLNFKLKNRNTQNDNTLLCNFVF